MLPLDAVRLGPADDATEVTAAQVREVTGRIIAAGHWRDGDPDIVVVFNAGYDLTKLAWLLRDLPVEVLGRLAQRPGDVLPRPPPRRARRERPPAAAWGRVRAGPIRAPGPPRRRPPAPGQRGFGTARAAAWDRLHQQLAAPRRDGKATMASCPSSRAP